MKCEGHNELGLISSMCPKFFNLITNISCFVHIHLSLVNKVTNFLDHGHRDLLTHFIFSQTSKVSFNIC